MAVPRLLGPSAAIVMEVTSCFCRSLGRHPANSRNLEVDFCANFIPA